MLIQFQIVLVLILVLENSFPIHRRNFARLCQAEWERWRPAGEFGKQHAGETTALQAKKTQSNLNRAISFWTMISTRLSMASVKRDRLNTGSSVIC
jgi:hypothetical protein